MTHSRARAGIASALLSCIGILACGDGAATEPGYAPVAVQSAPAPDAPATAGAGGSIPAGRLAFELEVLPLPSDGASPYHARIYTMRTDGTGLLALTPPNETGRAPAWSPDGSRLAYESHHDGAPDIWTVRPDGSGRTLVARPATAPFWLDDTHLGYQCGASLCAIRDDGSQQRTLLARDSLPNAADFAYQLSNDGKTIVFTRLTYVGPDAPSSRVYVMNADGTGERRLSATDQADSPQWSPVGRRIAFASATLGVVVADLDRGEVHSVSQGLPRGVSSPGWSPSGAELVFGNDVHDFFIARADGTGIVHRGSVPITIDSNRASVVNAWAWTSR
jgi:dipeptidyl aminopeptidase/acylaminoacyl peptidase